MFDRNVGSPNDEPIYITTEEALEENRQRAADAPVNPEPVRESRPWVPTEERFIRLQAAEIIGQVKTPDPKTAAKNAARFFQQPPPGPGADYNHLNAYRERAVRAGIKLTAEDLATYQGDLEDALQGATLASCQKVVVGRGDDFFKPSSGATLLAQAVLHNNPKLVEELKLENMQVADNQQSFGPPALTKDLDPAKRLHENPERFRAEMRALGKMGPMSNKPTADDIGAYRAQLRNVGVRLTLDDVKTYQKLLAEKGSRGMLAPGATNDTSLSVAMLADLHRKPAERELVGNDAEHFAHALLKRPQMRPQLPPQDQQQPPNAQAAPKPNIPRELPYDKLPPLGTPVLGGEVPAVAKPETPYDKLPPLGTTVLGGDVPEVAKPESTYDKLPPLGTTVLGGEVPEVTTQRNDAQIAEGPKGPQITRGGKTLAMRDGYHQTGPIVMFDPGRGEVVQRVSKDETVTYKLDDFDRVMSRDALKDVVTYGHEMHVSTNHGEMSVANQTLERGDKYIGQAMPYDEKPAREKPTHARSGPYGVPIPSKAPAEPPSMIRDGKAQAIPSGYQRTGRLFMGNNGEVSQRIDKDNSVRYSETDVREALGGADELKRAVANGDDVRIRVNRGEMSATNMARENAQQRTSPSTHSRS